MTISAKMITALNKQINAELESSYLYLAMAAWFHEENFPGFAAWMEKQATEENVHGMKIYHHIIERGGKVTLAPIKVLQQSWKSPLDAFKASLAHEREITGKINKLMNLANVEKDYATASFLTWYVNEQVEEEAAVDDIVQKLTRAKESMGALLMFDSKLGKRE